MPVSPITVQGNLRDILSAADAAASISVLLCNYGGLIPRVPTIGVLARVAPADISPDGSGHFSFQVYGNDVIVPGTTFYTVTVKDDDGNVVMTGAYYFSGAGPYDLSTTPQYNPPPLPTYPPIIVVPYAPNVVIDLTQGDCFLITLTGDITIDVSGLQVRKIFFIILVQDGVGGHNVTWTDTVVNGTPCGVIANDKTPYMFLCLTPTEALQIGLPIADQA